MWDYQSWTCPRASLRHKRDQDDSWLDPFIYRNQYKSFLPFWIMIIMKESIWKFPAFLMFFLFLLSMDHDNHEGINMKVSRLFGCSSSSSCRSIIAGRDLGQPCLMHTLLHTCASIISKRCACQHTWLVTLLVIEDRSGGKKEQRGEEEEKEWNL